ncbi:MAG: hypothetical protein HQL87_01360 [Magnetococcales bacterium]|nr:hypothetical protein [Magnetococcales bacterium]
MNEQAVIESRVQAARDECAKHHRRLQAAWAEAVVMPALQGNSPDALTEAEVRILDQLVFRFGRLQDAMGTRLLPALLQYGLDWQERESFLDALNRAEKREMIPSTDQWVDLRKLRNQTAHEYPERPDWVMTNLRNLVANTPQLLEIHTHMVAWMEKNIHL